jgi:elongation factor Ts
MNISASEVKRLRDETGAGMMDCKRALQEAGGDRAKALDLLREQGLAAREKRKGKAAHEGIIASYTHFNGKVAVLVELNSETDFVARTDDFKNLGKELAMQIAMMNPPYLHKEDVPAEALEKEREILRAQPDVQSKPEHVQDRIIEGRLNKFYEQVCLMEQPYIRDDKLKVKDLLNEATGRLGENLQVRRYVRMQVGETAEEE